MREIFLPQEVSVLGSLVNWRIVEKRKKKKAEKFDRKKTEKICVFWRKLEGIITGWLKHKLGRNKVRQGQTISCVSVCQSRSTLRLCPAKETTATTTAADRRATPDGPSTATRHQRLDHLLYVYNFLFLPYLVHHGLVLCHSVFGHISWSACQLVDLAIPLLYVKLSISLSA